MSSVTLNISFSRPWFLIFLTGIGLLTCKPSKSKFSDEPFLTLTEVKVQNSGFVKDSFVSIKLHFTDGDGDIGLNPADTSFPFGYGQEHFYNLHLWMYERQNGAWVKPINPLLLDTLNFHERIGNLTPSGSAKWITGDLQLFVPAEPYSLKPDSVKFQVSLTDRKLHRSNQLETDLIILKH